MSPHPAARQVQWLSENGDPAGERSARSRRLQSLPVLRPPETLHGGAAGHVAGRREAPARILRASMLRRHHHDQLQGRRILLPADDRRHFVAWSDSPRTTSRSLLERVMDWYAAAATATSPHILLNSISPASTRRRRRRRPRHSGPSPTPTARPRKPSSPTSRPARSAQSGRDDDRTIRDEAIGEFEDWIRDRKNRRAIPYRLEACGYVPVRNPHSKQGLWRVNGVRQAIYTKASLPPAERLKAAKKLAE